MARRTKLKVEVHETFYGEAEVRGKDTVLWVLLLPAGQQSIYNLAFTRPLDPQKEFKLVMLPDSTILLNEHVQTTPQVISDQPGLILR